MAEFSISSSVVRSKMPELDTLRGIAVLLVLFFHGFNLVPIPHEISSTAGRLWVVITSTGWMGVNLFFVLSGFLITGILIESRETPNYFKRFYFRRALRILPAYYAILLVLLLVTYFGLVDRRVGWPFIGLSFIYLANVTPLFGVAAQYSTLWSLAVEEHFYLLWPAAVRYVSRRKLLYTCLAIIIACPVLRALYYVRGYDYGAPYTWLVADPLACGAVLAILVRGPIASRTKLLAFASLTFGAGIVLFLIGFPFGIYLSRTWSGGTLRYTFLNLIFVGVIAGTLYVGTGAFARWVNIAWLKFFGEISYGLYLVHRVTFDVVDHAGRKLFPATFATTWHMGQVAIRFVIGGALAVLLAFLSRWYFEERFLRLKNRAFAASIPGFVGKKTPPKYQPD